MPCKGIILQTQSASVCWNQASNGGGVLVNVFCRSRFSDNKTVIPALEKIIGTDMGCWKWMVVLFLWFLFNELYRDVWSSGLCSLFCLYSLCVMLLLLNGNVSN